LGGLLILMSLKWMKKKSPEIPWFALGASSTIVCFIAYLSVYGAFSDLVNDCFLWALSSYAKFNEYPFLYKEVLGAIDALHKLYKGEQILTNLEIIGTPIFVGLVPLLLLPLCAISSYMKRNWELWVISVGGLALFLSSHNHPDFLHLLHVMPFSLIIFFTIVENPIRELQKYKNKALFSLDLVLCVPCILFVLWEGTFLRGLTSFPTYWLKTYRGYIAVPFKNSYYEKRDLFHIIKSHASVGDYIFVYHWSPVIYFISGMKNPTPFDSYLPIYNSSEHIRKILESIGKTKPQVVIKDDYIKRFFDPRDAVSLSFPFVDRPFLLEKDFLDRFILREYSLEVDIGQYKILLKRNESNKERKSSGVP